MRLLKRLAKKIEEMCKVEVGVEDDSICNRNHCPGTIQSEEGSCYCSACGNPPCSYCTDHSHYCDTCDWEE